MITSIRTLSQQLATPQFNSPEELVKWMGAVQAQDYTMAKWAIGTRLQSGTIGQVEKALEQGGIIRTHIMRPTWHFVAAEDLRWLIQLTGHRVRAACDSYVRNMEISDSVRTQCSKLLEKILEGNNHLTKQEVAEEFGKAGLPNDNPRLTYTLGCSEASGLICSGVDKNKKPTYALLDERIAPTKTWHKDEALAELARRYFSSHSPASFEDFLWWTGLTITETRHAIHLIESELIKERFASQELFIHQSWKETNTPGDVLHFLPPYDEYLISYKNRTAALAPEHHSKAFNNYGIFQPVIMHNGKIVGNWKKVTAKGKTTIETSFFEKKTKVSKTLLKEGEERFLNYLSNK